MKNVQQVIDEASDSQAKRWFADISAHVWPKDMPIPQEAFEVVWHRLQKRVGSPKKVK